ncbi:MAG: glycosyltransferase family 4 protein [Deltaproteobacteria bacterium]|nr:glycosyltransferase family 4 protein [Deltaproteobacteria bacterium]
MPDLQLTYFGILRAPTSWAKVGREMVSALIDLGVDLNLFERKGFLYNPDIALPLALQQRITRTFRDDIVFTFEHPGTYRYLRGLFKVGMLTYESTVVPPRWVENARRFLDLLLLPSGFCRELFLQAGLAPDKTLVLPYGYRPDIYYKRASGDSPREEKPYRFLTVASPHKREGLDVLLKAYAGAFSARDEVVLVIKLNYLPKARSKAFEQPELLRLIDDLKSRPDAPRISVLTRFLSENSLANLYRSASCFVSATRGEGFGMACLEALACGLPIIVTGWGGQLDFLSPENARLVRYHLRKAKEIQYDCQDAGALIAEPDLGDLAERMRAAFEERNFGATAQKEKQESELEAFTWRKIAERFVEIVSSR